MISPPSQNIFSANIVCNTLLIYIFTTKCNSSSNINNVSNHNKMKWTPAVSFGFMVDLNVNTREYAEPSKQKKRCVWGQIKAATVGCRWNILYLHICLLFYGKYVLANHENTAIWLPICCMNSLCTIRGLDFHLTFVYVCPETHFFLFFFKFFFPNSS